MWLTLEQHKRENDKLKAQAAQIQGELQAALTKRGRLEAVKREDDAVIARLTRQLEMLQTERESAGAQLETALSHAQSRYAPWVWHYCSCWRQNTIWCCCHPPERTQCCEYGLLVCIDCMTCLLFPVQSTISCKV